MNAVALFSNRTMLPGLHATLSSLLRALPSASANAIDVHLFLDRVGAAEQARLRQTHERHADRTRLHLHDYSPTAPRGGNSLHGNLTAYGRIHLADLLPDRDRCVYLDCDLIVNRPITEMFDLFDTDSLLLVDGTGRRGDSLDKDLFAAAGLDPNGPCFNSGVMGMNLALWRQRGISAVLEETGARYAGRFASADQALLNVALHDAFKSVGAPWNTALYPSTARLARAEPRIYHFVGSPKPWDMFGDKLHSNAHLWQREYEATAIAHRSPLRYASVSRSARISRQYFKALFAGPR